MLEVGSSAIRNGMEYFHSGCVFFASRGNEWMGYAKERKGIRGVTEYPSFCCCWQVLLFGWRITVQYTVEPMDGQTAE